MKKLALIEVLEGIEDTRRKHSVMYPYRQIKRTCFGRYYR